MAFTRKRNKSTKKEKSSVLKGNEEINEAESSLISPECQIYLTLGGAFLFSCLCTALIWYMLLRERGIEYTAIHSTDLSSLYRIKKHLAGAAINNGEPRIIRNSIINRWRAKKLWSPQLYLRSKLERLDGVYENNNPWFGP